MKLIACVFVVLVLDVLVLARSVLNELDITASHKFDIQEKKMACPKIISREEWGARNVTINQNSTRPVPYVIIHHAASPSCLTQEKCSALCRAFQNYHIDNRDWDDIGYNFLIGGDGLVYEGRGWNRIGAHALNWNRKSIGICFIGTFINEAPIKTAHQAAKELIECGVNTGEISDSYKLIGHRQVRSTECPGQVLYELIKTWPHWTDKPV